MFSSNNFISLRQLKFLIILDIFGMGITILPRKLAEYGGQNGWLIMIISLLLAVFCLFLINKLAMIYPEESFFSYSSKIVGKPLGIIISLGFIIKIILGVSFEIRVFSEILKEVMLFNTPFWIISFIMLILGGYMASKGYEARGRIAEILIFIVFIPLVFVFFVTLFGLDFSNLMPFLKEMETNRFLEGSVYTLYYFSGIEFVLFVYPFIKDKKEIKKASLKALLFVGIVMVIISVITIAKFGKYDLVNQLWPVLEMMDTLDLPGSFIERQDALIMTFWIISIFMIINAGVFFSSLLIKDIVKKGTHTLYICICLPIIYIISLIPKNIGQVYIMMDKFYNIFGLLYIFIIPLFLLIVAKIRRLNK